MRSFKSCGTPYSRIIGISIWIFIVGIKIFRESYDVLMDTAIDNDSKKKILNK